MFRRAIVGSSRATDMSYQATQGDEVEDLAALIAYAKQQMPEIEVGVVVYVCVLGEYISTCINILFAHEKPALNAGGVLGCHRV